MDLPVRVCSSGNAYAAGKNSPDKSWQQAAYTDEVNPQQSAAAQEAARPYVVQAVQTCVVD